MHIEQQITMPGRTDPAQTARDNPSGLFFNSSIGGTVRYPNLRYGNPTEFAYYAMGVPLADLARRLRRDERTVRDWLSGRTRVPWWVPEIMRLKRIEADLRHRQMGMGSLGAKLGLATADVITLAQPTPKDAQRPSPVPFPASTSGVPSDLSLEKVS